MKDPRLRLTAPMRNMLMILLITTMLLCGARVPAALPVPKEGLLIRKDRADAVRRELLSLLDEPVVVGKRGIRTVADQAVLDWPAVKAEVEPHLDELLDLEQDRNPKEYVSDDARGATKRLSEMVHATAKLGMMYFLTGRDEYAQTAYEIIALAARVPRWGWFNWDGVNVPQIPFGMYIRNVAFALDFCWDGWSPTQRRRGVEILAEKGVEHYWRLVSLSPFMGLHHLRSKNQGSNVLSAAVIASLAVGDDVPENRNRGGWRRSAATPQGLASWGLAALDPRHPLLVRRVLGSALSRIAAESGPTNVSYYPRPGQISSHRAYKHRTRKIAYVRSASRERVYDYFVFVDRVEHDDQRWHGFNWHFWSNPGNEGRYEAVTPGSVLARRPNAAVLLATLSHDAMTYERQAIPSQPTVAYVFDHNARLLRAIAGRSQPPQAPPVTLPARLWGGGGIVKLDGRDAALFEDFSRPKEKTPSFRATLVLQPGCRYRASLTTCKEDARIYENFAWVINLKLLDRHGKVLADAADAHSSRDPHPLKLTSPASNLDGYDDWKETATHFTAPADVAAIEATLLPATYGHGTGLKRSSKVWLSDVTLTPLGVPLRNRSVMIVTLAVPLENDGPLPKIVRVNRNGVVEATVTHPDGTSDRIAVNADGTVSVTRTGKPSAAEPTVLRYDDRRRPGTGADSLATNSPQSQARLKAGMAKLTQRLLAERDKYVRRGWKNVALHAAEVKASGTRDDRFAARNLIDNKTWEVPIDGVVDYTLGTIATTGNGGYGRGPLPYDRDLSTWELYFRPTYWLLPPGQPGQITIKLNEPTRLKLIRLLNTTNAGLNDFATVDCRLELLADDNTPLWSRDLSFGRPWDRAFQAAFAKPEFFGSYGEAFDGILEPGVIVPFGAGWLEVPVDLHSKVRSIRLSIDKFWAMGGGLNEIQAYASPAP